VKRRVSLALFCLVFWSANPLAAKPASLPGWLVGCHIETTRERWTEECWTAPRAGIMLGSGRSGKGETLSSWEFMRIERDLDGKLIFWGSPSGTTPIAFKAQSVTESEIVFANPAHDYPQRIRYWREGKILNAETALSDGSKAVRWRYGGQED
jgi:Domain of unknown function (DUF6265)